MMVKSFAGGFRYALECVSVLLYTDLRLDDKGRLPGPLVAKVK